MKYLYIGCGSGNEIVDKLIDNTLENGRTYYILSQHVFSKVYNGDFNLRFINPQMGNFFEYALAFIKPDYDFKCNDKVICIQNKADFSIYLRGSKIKKIISNI